MSANINDTAIEFKTEISHFAAMSDTDAKIVSNMVSKQPTANVAPQSIPVPPNDRPIVVAAMYKFVCLDDLDALRGPLVTQCHKAGLYGTILIAHEGINGTISGDHAGISQLVDWLQAHPLFCGITPKYSFVSEHAFNRMKVRIKKEIVSMGQPDIDPSNRVGRYVKPEDWNGLINAEDTLVIDTRNHYEVAIGSFEGAVNPMTDSFRDFPEWVDNYINALPEGEQPENIAMFCTGGIRCEKSTSYLVSKGFKNVFHLEGGILKYLETVEPDGSCWQGECFVFDHRVSVGHGLKPGKYDLCHACRMPISQDEKLQPTYVAGQSCPKCHDSLSEDQKQRFAQRQKQIALARERGEKHIGPPEVDA